MKKTLQTYKDLQDIIAILGIDELSEDQKADRRSRSQDAALPVAAVPRGRAVHGLSGTLCEDRRHRKGFKDIVEGKYDDIPEQAFYMKGPIEEVLEAAEKMKKAA